MKLLQIKFKTEFKNFNFKTYKMYIYEIFITLFKKRKYFINLEL